MSDATTALAAAQAAAASSSTASDAADFAAEKAVEVNTAKVAAQTAKTQAETARADAQAAAAAAGAQMWVAGEAVTTATVRQAPDGSRIRSNAARTTRATFDPTEQGFWTPVLSTAGTLEQVALSATIASYGGAAWVTGTAYKRGRVIVNPSGAVVIANVDHTAAASYATDAAKWDAVSALDFALAPDNGKRPVGKGEVVLVPEDFGAVGDWNGTTGTDDTAAWTKMLTELASTAINSGSYIQLTKNKNYRVNGLTPFVGLKIRGCGPAARMTSTLLDMFTITGTLYQMVFEDVYFYSHTTGGHLFAMATNANLSEAQFDRCIFTVQNPAKSVFDGPDIGSFIENTFTDCKTTLSGTSHTVPAFYLRSNNGGLNLNQWIRGQFAYTGNYAIWLESTVANYCYDNLIQDVNWEVCNGGCVYVLSGNNTRIIGGGIYDLGTTTKDLFRFGKSASGLKGKYATVQNVQRRGGTLGAGLYDIKFDGAGATFNTVEDCDTGTSTGFQINWGFEAGTFKGGGGVTHTGDDGVAKQIYGADLIQEKLLATVTGIDAKTVAVTNLYTVPTGKKCNITKIVVRCTAASSVTVAPTVGAGSDAGGVNMFAAEVLTGLTATTQSWHMVGKGLRPIVSAAGIVKLGITGGATASSQTLAVDVFGYLTV